MASVKGKLFEYFVYKMLVSCGFRPVKADGLLIYHGSSGTMIQGLGQPHNADVLLAPPVQTPFYFPTRLLIECKCYSEKIGLPIIRNALGLREDINGFDIVTEDILKNRRSSRSTGNTCYPMKRYQYQVAVASMSGFKSTALPFAQAHRIPLISFADSACFRTMRNYTEEIESRATEDGQFGERVLSVLQEKWGDLWCDFYPEWDCDYLIEGFLKEVDDFQEKITIGLLEDGSIIFMVKSDPNAFPFNHRDQYNRYEDGCTIHWSDATSAWELCDGDSRYYFELPAAIYQEWMKAAVEQRRAALMIKEDYFSRIVLFEGYKKLRILQLSEQFMREQTIELENKK